MTNTAASPAHAPVPAFAGFSARDLDFLTGLAANNDKVWFTAHRAAYDDGLKPAMGALIAALNSAFAARGLPFEGEARKNIFRIHRDVRFSKDKRPYKTHVSASLTREGDKMAPGMVYVHVEPEPQAAAFDPQTIDPLDPSTLPSAQGAQDDYAGSGPFVAVGFYLWDRPLIDAFRRQIVRDPKAWRAVETALEKTGLALETGAPVKRMPKGYEGQADGPLAPALKRTHWLVRRQLTAADLASPGLPDLIADVAAGARPLLDFGWRALHGVVVEPARRR
ncbi:DUF2461 domain-containing protein [Caulobacter sp. KR2-114]|uniref:DUF2461 domain-containing protein n=1 Tax=Caulobacter sp. KR2-114 TaxID=3400912 RepID=UPI003BFE2BA9